MIPYFNIDRLPSIGPLKIHVFGILVACGILYGSKLTQDRGRELGLTSEKVGSMITTILVSGFLFSHVFDVFAYQMSGETPTLSQWLNPFSGISSFGGFAGALGGLFGWCHYHKEKVMKYADSLGYGLAAGWAFGRAGCFTAHDHPGHLTDFFLAVKYPGGPRHDLGLYEFIWAFCVASLFAVMKRRGNQPLGIYVAILTTAYAPVRFGLDFLRATDVHGADPRYFGLTPGHYSSIAVMIAGLVLCRWVAKHGREQNPESATPAPEAPAKKRK